MKNLLQQSDDPYMALLLYRSTPFPWCKLSPSELLMGRRVRSNIPLVKDQLVPDWNYLGAFRESNRSFKLTQKSNYDRRHRVRPLPEIPIDSEVWITSGDKPVRGAIVSVADTPRSYIVQTPKGQVRRNREHLNVVPRTSVPRDQSPPRERSPIMTRTRTGTAIHAPNRYQ